MGAYSGPEISNDGLVFHYDMENTDKSFKGKPTTNLFLDATNLNTGNWTRNRTSYDSSTKKATISSNTAGNYFLQDRTLTNGIAYTISLEAKAAEAKHIQFAPSTGFTIANYANINLIDGSITGSVAGITKASSVPLEDGWWRISYTETSTSTYGRIAFSIVEENTSRLSSPSGLSIGDGVYIRTSQMEVSDFATPFVNGTRSNTEAILDLTGTKTITASNLSYNSDNTLEFDGTDDYLTLSSSIDIYQKSFTIEAWIKRNVSNVEHGIFGDLQYHWFRFHITSANKVSLWFGYYNENNIALRNEIYSTGTVGTDWTHVAVTFENGVGQKIYLNGELSATNTNGNAFALTGGSRGPRYIGRADTSAFGSSPNFFNGEISNLKGYSDKTLTANEIKNNYLATKSRYGL